LHRLTAQDHLLHPIPTPPAATANTIRYEDYLDSQITGTDMYYLENIELARQLVELG
jgi:hypothetical protein